MIAITIPARWRSGFRDDADHWFRADPDQLITLPGTVITMPRNDFHRRPGEGWVWPASTHSGHVEPSTFRKVHANTFKSIAKQAGCDAWTLARIGGHSNVSMSSRYVHPSENAVLDAMARLGGHKSGHNETKRLD
jgi:hypothetical protein